MNFGESYIEVKILMTVAFIVVSILVLFLNPKANHREKPWPPFFLYPGPLFKEDGTMRKYTKIDIVIFFLSWIPFLNYNPN